MTKRLYDLLQTLRSDLNGQPQFQLPDGEFYYIVSVTLSNKLIAAIASDAAKHKETTRR